MVPTSQSKYRGTPTYDRVRRLLIEAARAEGFVSYSEIAAVMGLPSQGSHMSRETGIMAGEISEDEHKAGRHLLTAILVRVTDSEPGSGFYKLAKMLGRQFRDTPGAQRRYWESERRAVYEYWKTHSE